MVPLASELEETQMPVRFAHAAGRRAGGQRNSAGKPKSSKQCKLLEEKAGGQNGKCPQNLRLLNCVPQAAV